MRYFNQNTQYSIMMGRMQGLGRGDTTSTAITDGYEI